MNCQDCGKNDALVHLTEISDGEVISTWLCSACARIRQEGVRNDPPQKKPSDSSEAALFGHPDNRANVKGAGDLLAAFLAEDGSIGNPNEPGRMRTCPVCGFEVENLFRLNKVGCPGCYDAFKGKLRPLLSRLHGRTIHLGKVPGTNAQSPSLMAELTRVRVALDKAVSDENFEEAARLRDLVKELQEQRNRVSGRNELEQGHE